MTPPAAAVAPPPTRPPRTEPGPPPVAHLPRTIADRLAALRSLPGNWDAHGSGPPRSECLRDAEWLLIRLAADHPADPPPRINATRGESIQLEVEAGPRYFEVELPGRGVARMFYEDEEKHVSEEWSGSLVECVGVFAGYARRVRG